MATTFVVEHDCGATICLYLSKTTQVQRLGFGQDIRRLRFGRRISIPLERTYTLTRASRADTREKNSGEVDMAERFAVSAGHQWVEVSGPGADTPDGVCEACGAPINLESLLANRKRG
jgi:hypothetical protein